MASHTLTLGAMYTALAAAIGAAAGVGRPLPAPSSDFYFPATKPLFAFRTGLLSSQGDEGDQAAPLAWRFLSFPAHFPFNLRAIY